MISNEECTKLFLEAVIETAEEIKKDALKIEKGSLDRSFRNQIRITAKSYLKLGEKILGKDGSSYLANYLYFEFERPISQYLGFTMPGVL